MSYKSNPKSLRRKAAKVVLDDMWDLNEVAKKVNEAESFWKNALYGRIAHKILRKICMHTYVLQVEPKENCQSCLGRHGQFWRFWPQSPWIWKLLEKRFILAG